MGVVVRQRPVRERHSPRERAANDRATSSTGPVLSTVEDHSRQWNRGHDSDRDQGPADGSALIRADPFGEQQAQTRAKQ